MIFFHECGHAAAMRACGVPFSPMVFIPFLGAVIAMNKHPSSALDDAGIALAGPVAGSVAAAATAAAGHALDSQLLMALGDWGFMINLFNLLPVGGLDGGRVGDALASWIPVRFTRKRRFLFFLNTSWDATRAPRLRFFFSLETRFLST